jgi:WD40 repeat protein
MRSNDDDGGKTFVFRRSHSRALHGIARGVVDVGFSPDGKILATAHSYNADSGEVKLWDSNTGAQLATLAVPDEGIASLAFSPDGKFLAGRTHALVERPASWGIVLWDVAARREVRRFRGHTGSISAMAFSPDGRTLVSSGGDKTTRFWDVATGREDGRIDNLKAWGREAAFSPDGRMLALSNGSQINLWDVPGNRLRASLEPPIERSSVYSIAYAPDGRTLAAAGTMYDQKANSQLARVWLYDVAREPFRLRATLTFDPEVAAMPNESPPLCSDVAFTPDGRRVVAAAMQMVLIWDAATGIGESASGRSPASGSSDQIAIPPDGRWLAITRPFGISIVDIPPSP